MRTIRVLSVLLFALGFLSLLWSSRKNDTADWQPMVCGFPGAGNYAVNRFRIGRPERYSLEAHLPAIHESGTSDGDFIYPNSEKSIPCDLNIIIKSLPDPNFFEQTTVQTFEFGSASTNEYGYFNSNCSWHLPKGEYEIKISSKANSPIVTSRGAYLALTVRKPTWIFDRAIFVGLGILMASFGAIVYFFCELKSA